MLTRLGGEATITHKRPSLYAIVASVVLLLLAACGGESVRSPAVEVVLVPAETDTLVDKSDAAPPPLSALGRPGGSYGFSRYFFQDLGGQTVTTLVEGPKSEQVRSTLSYVQIKQLYDSGDLPPEELQMTLEELGELVDQLDTVRGATLRYRSVDLASADGYLLTDAETPNMGAHFVNSDLVDDGAFDPSRPEFLLYTQAGLGEWELVGVGFILPTDLVGEDHPEGFAGALDNWHVHYSLCLGRAASVTGSATPEECREQGGTWKASFGWMIHTYVWVDNPLGVFSMWNPNIPPVASAADIRENWTIHTYGADEVGVVIENFGHPEVHLKAGETVFWTNVDGVPHTVTADSRTVAEGGFDSGYIGPGQSFALKFEPGEYSYICTLHPSMNGTVVVTR